MAIAANMLALGAASWCVGGTGSLGPLRGSFCSNVCRH